MALHGSESLVIEKYYKGWSVKKIADVFECTENEVYNVINTVKKQWRDRNLETWTYYVHEELERLKILEAEIWIAWEESKQDIVQVTESVSNMGDDNNMTVNTVRKSSSRANPKFTEQLLQIHKARAELLRLYPTKSSTEQNTIIVTDEQIKTLSAIMGKPSTLPASNTQAVVVNDDEDEVEVDIIEVSKQESQ